MDESKRGRLTALTLPVNVDNSQLLFVLDTGAAISILDHCEYVRLLEGGSLLPLQECAQCFHAVNGTELPVYGKVDMSVVLMPTLLLSLTCLPGQVY